MWGFTLAVMILQRLPKRQVDTLQSTVQRGVEEVEVHGGILTGFSDIYHQLLQTHQLA